MWIINFLCVSEVVYYHIKYFSFKIALMVDIYVATWISAH